MFHWYDKQRTIYNTLKQARREHSCVLLLEFILSFTLHGRYLGSFQDSWYQRFDFHLNHSPNAQGFGSMSH